MPSQLIFPYTLQKRDGSDGSSRTKAKSTTGGILPPPPMGVNKLPPPPGGLGVSREATPTSSPTHAPNSAAAPSNPNPPASSNSSWVQF